MTVTPIQHQFIAENIQDTEAWSTSENLPEILHFMGNPSFSKESDGNISPKLASALWGEFSGCCRDKVNTGIYVGKIAAAIASRQYFLAHSRVALQYGNSRPASGPQSPLPFRGSSPATITCLVGPICS
jgi:hypothetical protein